jgi:hypothetical protein
MAGGIMRDGEQRRHRRKPASVRKNAQVLPQLDDGGADRKLPPDHLTRVEA